MSLQRLMLIIAVMWHQGTSKLKTRLQFCHSISEWYQWFQKQSWSQSADM